MTELEIKLKQSLNNSQFEAAMHTEGAAVLVAGAGSGKTHTLISRVAHLVDEGADPHSILMLTFTNAAANEMKSRATKILDSRCGEIEASTYHAFCNKLLRKYGKNIGLNSFTLQSTQETNNIIAFVKNSHSEFDEIADLPTKSDMNNIMSAAINKRISVSKLLDTDFKYCKFVPVKDYVVKWADYIAEYKWNERKLTYDDLLYYTDQLLSIEPIASAIANTYRYIMVDEYQDTNDLQESILMKIGAYNPNIVVVGDASQSIYAFRGANVKNIQEFSSKLPGCKTIVLNKNYRSTQEILDSANGVMRKRPLSWQYHDMISNDKNGNKPAYCEVPDRRVQAALVTNMIMNKAKDVPFNDIAVLVRSSRVAGQLEVELNKLGVPYKKLGGTPFAELKCVGDMMAYFRLLTAPHDSLAWFRILQLHKGVSEKRAREIVEHCFEDDFSEFSRYSKQKWYPELKKLSSAYHDFISSINDFPNLFAKVEKFYFETRKNVIENGSKSSDAKKKALEELEKDQDNIAILKEIALNYESVNKFQEDIVLDSLKTKNRNDVLTISTVHSAKGLEWDTVIILDCVDGAFPKAIPIQLMGGEEDEEELRCFYVAMTRAKNSLCLIAPHFIQGISGPCAISRYLSEGPLRNFNTCRVENSRVQITREQAKLLVDKWSNKDDIKKEKTFVEGNSSDKASIVASEPSVEEPIKWQCDDPFEPNYDPFYDPVWDSFS